MADSETQKISAPSSGEAYSKDGEIGNTPPKADTGSSKVASEYADVWNAGDTSDPVGAVQGLDTPEDRRRAAAVLGSMTGAPQDFSTVQGGCGTLTDGQGQSSRTTAGQTTVMCPLWMEMKKPWRKRHPVKFWLGIIVLLFMIPSLIFSVGDEFSTRDKVAVVNVQGMILDGSLIIKWIEEVQKDPRVKGVLVRVNSPGGAVTPSQEIYFALKRLASKKPVVVSMGALAASGGYYVSLPAHRIFAAPSTVTGSIGVKMELTNVEDLMGKLGVASTSLASGAMKDAGSPFKPLKEEERQYFLGVVMDMYEDFLATVIEHRKLTMQQLDGFADGRALTGRQAKELGLVDVLGDKNDALAYLYRECGLAPGSARLVEGPEKPLSALERLTQAAINSVFSGGAAVSGTPVFMYR